MGDASLHEAMAIQTAYFDLMRAVSDIAPDLSPDIALMLALIGDQTLTPTEIMRRKYFNGTNMSYSLVLLEKAGFIIRSSAPDRRKRPVTLTRKGMAIAHDIANAFSEEARRAA
jgi:DNA-binding MarR family transcriptional regulator